MDEQDVCDWLAKAERDHPEAECSRQALAVLGLTAAALRADGGATLPVAVRAVCAAIAGLRAIVRGEVA